MPRAKIAKRAHAEPPPPHLTLEGSIRHPSRVASAVWRDPDDTAAMERDERGRAHQRTIAGYRVIDPLSRLPCDVDHHKAARRLRGDWERGSGATSGASEAGKVDNVTRDHDSIAAQLEARRRYEDAVQAVGMRGCVYLLPVLLAGWTVADLLKRFGGNAMTMQGRVMGALDKLTEHYGYGTSVATIVLDAPWRHAVRVPVVGAVPVERGGRWR